MSVLRVTYFKILIGSCIFILLNLTKALASEGQPPCPGSTPQSCNANQFPNVCELAENYNILKGSECLDLDIGQIGICACNKETHVNDCGIRECLLFSSFVGDPCIITSQCARLGFADDGVTPLSICAQGHCQCNEISISNPDATKCLMKRSQIDQSCESDVQCFGLRFDIFDPLPDITTCNPVTRTCDCGTEGVPGLEIGITSKKCFRIAQTVGDTCDYNNQCQVRLGDSLTTRCEGSLCNCIAINAFEKDGKCVRRTERDCSSDEQCSHLGNSSCTFPPGTGIPPRCLCSDGFPSIDETRCLDYVRQVGGQCFDKRQCIFLGEIDVLTDCWVAWGGDPNQYCECIPETAISSVNRNRCLALIRDGISACEESNQCTAPYSECRFSVDEPNLPKCRCVQGFIPQELNPLVCIPDIVTETTTEIAITSTTLDPDTYNCLNHTDGFYPHISDCSKFYGCLDEDFMGVFDCPPLLLFNPELRKCDDPEWVDCQLSCSGKPDGSYPHPHDCSLFIICKRDVTEVFQCPPPLLFDPVISACNFPQMVECAVRRRLESY